MVDKNLDGNGLSEVWVRAAQLVKKYTGAVDLTKGDLQTQVNGKLSGTDDTKDNTVTFTSADELNPTAWKDVNVLSSKEKHLSLLNKISTMFSNVRYLYNILGTTDISALGTVTQAIATLNGNVGSIKGISSSAAITTQGQYALDAREKNASINGTLANELSKVNSNLQTYKTIISESTNLTVGQIITPSVDARQYNYFVISIIWRNTQVVRKRWYDDTYDVIEASLVVCDTDIAVIRHVQFLINRNTGKITLNRWNQSNLQESGTWFISDISSQGVGLYGVF